MNPTDINEIIEEAWKNNSVELDLSDFLLTKVPKEIGKLTKLKRLFLHNNRIEELPGEIGELKELTGLFLDNNLLTRLPSEIGQFRNLRQLYLNENRFQKFPKEISQLKNLSVLELGKNRLSQFPLEILQLPQLKEIHLEENKVTQLPKSIVRLKNLEELKIQGNPLTLPPLEIAVKGVSDIFDFFTNRKITYFFNSRNGKDNTLLEKLEKELDLMPEYEFSPNNCKDNTQIPHLFVIIQELDEAEEPKEIFLHLDWARSNQVPVIVFYAGDDFPFPKKKINFDRIDSIQNTLRVLKKELSDIHEYNSEIEFLELFHAELKRNWIQQKIPSITLKSLHLRNIGVFESLDLDFPEKGMVMTGLNGTGKTTILRAIVLAIVGPQQRAQNNLAESLLRIIGRKGDVCQWAKEGRIRLVVKLEEDIYENEILIQLEPSKGAIQFQGKKFWELFEIEYFWILMIAFGQHRAVPSQRVKNSSLGVPHAGIQDLIPFLLNQEVESLPSFASWIANLDIKVKNGDFSKKRLIEKTFQIFSDIMGEKTQFDKVTSVDPLELWVKTEKIPDGIPLRLTSQGYQSVMGWVGNLLSRMDEVYESIRDFEQLPAVVLVDEIDLFLHPQWQQKIFPVLRKHFPNVQFITTSHSPLVVDGLERNEVIQLRYEEKNVIAETNPVDLWAWNYLDILNRLFDTRQAAPEYYEEKFERKIKELEDLDTRTEKQKEELEGLKENYSRLQESRLSVDEIASVRKRLEEREQEVIDLLQQYHLGES